MPDLAERHEALATESKWDFSDLSALFINCTLKRSPEVSNTRALGDLSAGIMERNGVSVEFIRAIDHDIATGVQPDMTQYGWEQHRGARRDCAADRGSNAEEHSRAARQAGVTADEVPSSPRESWAGSVRDRLCELGMQEMYQGAFAGPSAYTHGSWHELAIYHLDEAEDGSGYYPDTAFADVRPQPVGLLTILTSEAVTEWLYKRLPETGERDGSLARLMAMHDAAAEIGQLHENFLGRTGGPELR
jgi:hypothetical protein